MYERKFTLDDQNIFAVLSGDYNDLHLDEIVARRYLFGGTVVHGVHMVLWALDKWVKTSDGPIEFVSLIVIFKRALRVGTNVKCRTAKEEDNHFKLEVYDEEGIYVSINASWRSSGLVYQGANNLDLGFPQRQDCKVLSFTELSDRNSEFGLCIEKDTVSRLFPDLFKKVPLIQFAEILATTRLVGMECPGFNSIFSELDLIFDSNQLREFIFKYKVVDFDSSVSLLSMEVQGPSMQGMVKALFRPPFTQQKSFIDLCKIVTPDEFKGQNAFIVGGSRGLGEVVAKLLAAGGARVVLTYLKGHQDALKIKDEIVVGGGHAEVMYFDVLSPAETKVGEVAGFSPTHLYYFATPFITGKKGIFSARLFKEFCDYYVLGFYNTLEFFFKHVKALGKVFYPSSIFVDEPPPSLGEYVAAKAAGESLCLFIEMNKRWLSIYRPKLPKMATDQTASIMEDDRIDPAATMLKELRDFNNFSR